VLAETAAEMETTPGRTWRPLQDTADAAQILYSAPRAWGRSRRSVDFYPEGSLVWLDADTLIREASHGERSLDDFARAFFGQHDGEITPRPYTFDDVVAALDKVQHYDWAHFLRARLDGKAPGAPLDGIVRGGWKLVYTDEPGALAKAQAKIRKNLDLSTSLGMVVDAGDAPGALGDVLWKSPAFEAGLAPGMMVVAVNGTKFTPDVLKDAIKAARTGSAPIELLVSDFDQFRTVKIDYHGGLRYPHLARIENSDERLDAIAHPRAATK
jgi:predicted metalloprotease with PDZ domain